MKRFSVILCSLFLLIAHVALTVLRADAVIGPGPDTSPEKLKIKVVESVKERPDPSNPKLVRVIVKAGIIEVYRTATGLKAGDTIDIVWTIDYKAIVETVIKREKRGELHMPGPQVMRVPPSPRAGELLIAKLRKSNGDAYSPDDFDWSFSPAAQEKAYGKQAETASGENARNIERNSGDRLYGSCDGHPFYVEDACPGEKCVGQGMEIKIFSEWKRQFMSIHKIPEDMFAKRILISDVSLAEGPKYVFWSVNYVFVLDWVRSRQTDVVNLGKYPLPGEPDEKTLARLVNSSIRRDRKYKFKSVAPLAKVESAFGSCAEKMKIDWCHIDFENRSGRLLIRGIATVPGEGLGRLAQGIRAPMPGAPPVPTCINAKIDLESAEVVRCTRGPCWMP